MPELGPERLRLDGAIVSLMVERGYEGMTVAAVAERAGVENAEFESHFADVEDAVLQVYWRHTEEFTELVWAAYEAEASWRDGLRAGAYRAARYLRDNPDVVRFGTVGMFSAGLMAQAQRESHLHMMVEMVDAGRQELDDPESVGRGVAEAVFGAIYEMLVKELQGEGGTRAAEEFVPDLMYIAVRPYLGHEAAREELAIPPPQEAGHDG